MDVNKTTIQRYENGSIDNTKKLIVEGLADALHVSAAWLRGETEDMGADMSDSRDFKIESAMSRIMGDFPLDMKEEESDFSKDLLLLFLYVHSVKDFKDYDPNYMRKGKQEERLAAGRR